MTSLKRGGSKKIIHWVSSKMTAGPLYMHRAVVLLKVNEIAMYYCRGLKVIINFTDIWSRVPKCQSNKNGSQSNILVVPVVFDIGHVNKDINLKTED